MYDVRAITVLVVDAGPAGQVLHELGPGVLLSGAELHLDSSVVVPPVDMDGSITRGLGRCHTIFGSVRPAVVPEAVRTESLHDPSDLLLRVEDSPTASDILRGVQRLVVSRPVGFDNFPGPAYLLKRRVAGNRKLSIGPSVGRWARRERTRRQ